MIFLLKLHVSDMQLYLICHCYTDAFHAFCWNKLFTLVLHKSILRQGKPRRGKVINFSSGDKIFPRQKFSRQKFFLTKNLTERMVFPVKWFAPRKIFREEYAYSFRNSRKKDYAFVIYTFNFREEKRVKAREFVVV